jgi:hypothetical protein
MITLCFWELTRRDSPALAAIAVLTLICMLSLMGYALFQITQLSRRSVRLHKNPAYMLYSDSAILNKWGFLYVHHKAKFSYFLIPTLLFAMAKGMFVGLDQKHAAVQAIAMFALELFFLVCLALFRPYMNKTTNAVYLSIGVVNLINAILFFLYIGILELTVSPGNFNKKNIISDRCRTSRTPSAA